jgi:hypothetical protein
MSIGSIGAAPPAYTPPLKNAASVAPPKNDPDRDGDVDGTGPDKDKASGSGVDIKA